MSMQSVQAAPFMAGKLSTAEAEVRSISEKP